MPGRGVERAEGRQVTLDSAQVADHAIGDELTGVGDRRVEAGPHGLHRENACGPRGFDDPGGVLDGCGEGFLDQDRLARRDGGKGDVGVLRMRCGDIDRVDVRVGDQGVIRPMRGGEAVLVGEGLGPLERARADRD